MAKKTETNSYQDKRLDQMENSMKVINSELGEIKVEMGELKTDFKWLKTEFVKIRIALDEISDKINKRPTWFITSVLTLLVSLIVYLLIK